MLLIVVLRLIAVLTLVSGECKLGTPKMNNFNWTEFSGPRPWYTVLHNSSDFEKNIDCIEYLVSVPEGNKSFITNDVYFISEKLHSKFYGYATNWNSSGYVEFGHSVSLWNGHAIFLAVDYDRYVILKYCPFESNKPYFYVSFRSQQPDEATVTEVLKKLKENNIDVSKMVKGRADHCQQADSSTAR